MSFAAFILQGSWAIYSNWTYGLFISLKSGTVQGVCSFFMTYIVTLAMEYLYKSFKKSHEYMRFFLTFVVSVFGMLSVQIVAHWVANTPEIMQTTLPAAVIGTMYCAIYTFKKSKKSFNRQKPNI